jgi:hypothetical protein
MRDGLEAMRINPDVQSVPIRQKIDVVIAGVVIGDSDHEV